MRKVYAVKPIDDIELRLGKNKKIKIRFDAKAVFHFTEIADISDVNDNSDYNEICTSIIYAGAVEHNENFTIEDAKEIQSTLDVETMIDIIRDFSNSMGNLKEKSIKNQTRQFQTKKVSR